MYHACYGGLGRLPCRPRIGFRHPQGCRILGLQFWALSLEFGLLIIDTLITDTILIHSYHCSHYSYCHYYHDCDYCFLKLLSASGQADSTVLYGDLEMEYTLPE